jgi:hypothetical protein
VAASGQLRDGRLAGAVRPYSSQGIHSITPLSAIWLVLGPVDSDEALRLAATAAYGSVAAEVVRDAEGEAGVEVVVEEPEGKEDADAQPVEAASPSIPDAALLTSRVASSGYQGVVSIKRGQCATKMFKTVCHSNTCAKGCGFGPDQSTPEAAARQYLVHLHTKHPKLFRERVRGQGPLAEQLVEKVFGVGSLSTL